MARAGRKEVRAARRRVLAIDVGGTHVKVLATGRRTAIHIPSGRAMTARAMVTAVRKATATWKYDVVSIGFPGSRFSQMSATWRKAARSRPTSMNADCMPGSTRATRPM